jgi:hypothetical protein
MFFNPRTIASLFLMTMLTGCVSHPPADVNNICTIFRQNPGWYRDAKDVEKRWRVPISVQMAIVHQESKFDAGAKPPRTKLFSIIPWKRLSSAYGYAQVLDGTWRCYKRSNGGFFSSRTNFADGLDFIGWYANQAYVHAKIPRNDAYNLYLAYHEGVGGYQRKTYLKKPWLIKVSHKVNARSKLYAMQLKSCQKTLQSRSWF